MIPYMNMTINLAAITGMFLIGWGIFHYRLYWALLALFDRLNWGRFPQAAAKWAYFKPWNQGTLVFGPKNYRLSIKDSMKHTLVIGGTGAGKTRQVILPSIFKLALSGHSMVVFDPSGEIVATVKKHLQRQGYQIQSLNLLQPYNSQGFNPLEHVSGALEIGELARILIQSSDMDKGDPFWFNGAAQMLEVVFHALLQQTKTPQLSDALGLLQRFQEKPTQEQLLNRIPEHIQNQLLGLMNTNPRVLSSFHAVALNSLRMLNVPEIAHIFAKNDIDFHQLRHEKTVIFLLFPIEKVAYYGFIMNLFYTQFFNAMLSRLPTSKELPVFALLDEFAHSKIPSMDVIASVIRKHNVALVLAIQSYSQMKSRYGQQAKTLVQNCQTRILLDPPDSELKYALNLKQTAYRKMCQFNNGVSIGL